MKNLKYVLIYHKIFNKTCVQGVNHLWLKSLNIRFKFKLYTCKICAFVYNTNTGQKYS